ncbi:hypothetical protein FPL11_05590 [Spiribacter aquaticus]|uniref:GNAT family N-acetyltransferase n=1 Tax=Spiribacter aquaticus TaxID=1935996 RepID=A0A557RK46_9GAMM|nr:MULTISPECIES: hypothetical protein [Spiribacter]TVO65538.1 hypothetical protein FPL11_05590 [Spiribacter aquaticus]
MNTAITPLRSGLEEKIWSRDTDYEMLAAWWWALDGWEPPPLQVLPDTGVILSRTGEPVCAGFWLISDNAPMAYLLFPVFSPDCSLKLLPMAAKVLFQRLADHALASGASQIATPGGNAAMRRIAENNTDLSPNSIPVYTAYWTSNSKRIVAMEE